MGTVAEKLSYLTDTKDLFKDRLNSLGAEITSSTTFRNYLNWLDTFYGEVSDKTDISINGIEGRTNQETTSISGGDEYDSPSPDHPQPINNLSGDVPYKVSGKNLFNKDNYKNIKAYISNSGAVVTNSQNTTVYIPCASNKTYTVSRISPTSGNNKFAIGTTSELPSGGMQTGSYIRNDTASSLTLTTDNNAKYLLVWCYVTDFVITLDETLASIQIEQCSTATTYEPYISQTFNIPLGDIELCKIDTYEDKIYSSDGRFYLEKNTSKIILDGTEDYVTSSVSTELYVGVIRDYASIISKASATNIYSNYFICVTSSQTGAIFISTTSGNVGLVFDANMVNNLNSMKQFITNLYNSGTPIIIYIPLAAPTTTEITQENYPALYNALKQIQDYLTSYKINKEFILGYSSPEIEY